MKVAAMEHMLAKDYCLYLTGHTLAITTVALTCDNKYIVTGSMDRTIRIWNIEEKTLDAVLEGHTKSVTAVSITSDNKYIVSISLDMTMRI